MPEILKRGELPEERKYQGTCSNCKSEIRFGHGEVNHSHSYDPRDGVSIFEATCPVCSKKMYPNRVGGVGLAR